MARIRSTKPEFWHDRKLARSCSREARMLYMGLWNYADEHGRLNGDPAVIKGQVFPYDDVDIEACVYELCSGGWVQRYEFDGDPYLFLPKLAKHQRLEAERVESRLPEPPERTEAPPEPPNPRSQPVSENGADSSERRADSSESSVASLCSREQGAGSREHVGTREARPKRGTKLPEGFELTSRHVAWAQEQTPAIDPVVELQQFLDHHRSKGDLSKDWNASWRTWMRNAQKWHKPRAPDPLAERRAQALSVIRNLQSESQGEIA